MSTTLTIWNLDESVQRGLRLQAARHQRSLEAEAREILTRAVAAAEDAPPASSDGMTPQERMRAAIKSVRGIWKGRMTTDEIMELTRGDDIDDAYTRG